MSTRPNGFEQFMMLFRELKRVAGTPQRLVTFHDEHSELQTALGNLENFLLRTDFERRAFAGKKLFPQVPDGFDADWKDYEANWAQAIAHLEFSGILPELYGNYEPSDRPTLIEREPPNFEIESSFDPLWHDGGAAFRLGNEYLEHVFEGRKDSEFVDDEPIANWCRIALDAHDYLTNTIGLDIGAVFQRWQSLPPIFMPARVSNKHGDEKGSLNHLLNDAIRAYVCGAPAAALALCRPIVDMLLKKHCLLSEDELTYIDKCGKRKDTSLKDLVAAAEKRHECWREVRLYPRIKRINDLLHDYSRMAPLDPKDDRFLRDFLLTLKMLIERSPKPA